MERRKVVTVGSISLEATKVKIGAVEIRVWPPEDGENLKKLWVERRRRFKESWHTNQFFATLGFKKKKTEDRR